MPRQSLTPDLLRQIRNLKSDEVNQAMQKIWGAFRETSEDKQKLVARYKKLYQTGGSQPGDGGKIGPDLTGSNRADFDYLLQNILDPNAVIPNEYRASTLETKDGRVITGIVKTQDATAITMLTANETLVIPANEIQSLQHNELSMMPEGLLEPLSEQEVRDLIFYLAQPRPAPVSADRR